MEIIINANSINDNISLDNFRKQYHSQIFEATYNQLAAGMELSELKSIIIPEDFELELFRFQKNEGLPVGCTDNEMGTAYAQVVSYEENGKVICTIFIHKYLFLVLFDDDGIASLDATDEYKNELRKLRQIAINTIHHELAHVHEYVISDKVNTAIYDNVGSLAGTLRVVSQSIWSEYFACRFSASTHSISVDEVKNILEQANNVEEKVIAEIASYRFHCDIDKLVAEIHQRTVILLKYAAYFMGYSYRFDAKDDREKIIGAVEEILGDTSFNQVWSKIDRELDNMYINFGNWDSPEVYDALGQVICEYWNTLGIYPEARENGVYYHIP